MVSLNSQNLSGGPKVYIIYEQKILKKRSCINVDNIRNVTPMSKIIGYEKDRLNFKRCHISDPYFQINASK